MLATNEVAQSVALRCLDTELPIASFNDQTEDLAEQQS